MTYTEMLEQARQAVADHKITWNDYESLVVSLNTHPPHDIHAAQVNYHEYIASSAWKAKADAAKARAGNKCQVCNRGKDTGAVLDAHHRTYQRLGYERPEDITVLCRECHGLYEQKGLI